MRPVRKRLLIGWRETISLPDLGINRFKAKFDTGALTTALHATDIKHIEMQGRQFVQFLPDHDGLDDVGECLLPILHRRKITNTSGIPEERFIVATTLQIGPYRGRIEVSLSDRSDMTFPIIIGRSAMRVMRLSIDPTRSWLQSTRSANQQEKI